MSTANAAKRANLRDAGWLTVKELKTRLARRDGRGRLRALRALRSQCERRAMTAYFRLARRRILDLNNDCRWQAIITVELFIGHEPESVWKVVARQGRSSDQDMRAAVGCCLLEHLLEKDFNQYFLRTQRSIMSGSNEMRGVLAFSTLWFDGLLRQRILKLLAMTDQSKALKRPPQRTVRSRAKIAQAWKSLAN